MVSMDYIMAADNLKVLDWLLTHQCSIDRTEIPSVYQWKSQYDIKTAGWKLPFDRAVIGGFIADRTAYAFAAGYESALRKLVPSLPENAIVSFCVTEDKGAHPSFINSLLSKGPDDSGWRLTGSKKFITMANEAEFLLVAVSTGPAPDGKKILRMIMVKRDTPGIAITPMAGLPFVTEISHGTVAFHDVPVRDSDILPGDGYETYIKSFRTVEDLHVMAAITAYIFRIACLYQWSTSIKEQLLYMLTSMHGLANEDPLAPYVHIALGGLLQEINALIESTVQLWEAVDPATRESWNRDKPLLKVAEQARTKRLEKAWSHYIINDQ